MIATASAGDTARIVSRVLAPTVAQGVIVRRRAVVAVAAALDLDGGAVRTLQAARDRYGDGPLLLRTPLRSRLGPVAVLLSPRHVHRVLTATPEPFAAATPAKRAALGHFQPHGVLVSHGRLREERRRFVEDVLDAGKPMHRFAGPFTRAAREEAAKIGGDLRGGGTLDFSAFATAWWRAVRRITLGGSARDDHETTDVLTRLRRRANWSGLVPQRPDLRARLRQRLQAHVAAAEPGSLAALVAAGPATTEVDPIGQLPQWLFAFDAAGMAAYRALALLATHPGEAERVRSELAGRDLAEPQDLPLLRAAVLESVRLWPTTPVVLRSTTQPTEWDGATLPAGTSVLVVSAFLHRDSATVPDADRFVPDRWSDPVGPGTDGGEGCALVPFSAGPAACPGRELVLLTTSTFLAALLERHDVRPAAPFGVDARDPLPRGLDPFAPRLSLVPRS